MSGGASSAEAVLQIPQLVRIMFYNPGIHQTQVSSEKLYDKWIRGRLRADVHRAILHYNADIIALCELGSITEGLGPYLAKWKTSTRATKPGDYHLVDDMLHELVDDPSIKAKHPTGWNLHATNHYGLLVSNHTVLLVDKPERVGPMTTRHAYRVAQRCSFTSNINSVEKPVKATELWNVHCPASNNAPYGQQARTQVCDFLQTTGGERVIWGGDLNRSLGALTMEANVLRPWRPRQPGNARHGDTVCSRGVSLELMQCNIGKGQPHGVSDAHVMVGVVLRTEFDSAAMPVGAVPDGGVEPMSLARHVAEMAREALDSEAAPASASQPTKDSDGDDSNGDDSDEMKSRVDFGGDSDDSDDPTNYTDAREWTQPEDVCAARGIIGTLSAELDAPEGPPDNGDDIHDLIRFLWFGKQFHVSAVEDVERGHARLADVFAEVRWIRDRFNSAGKPAENERLTTDEVTKIHKAYRDNMY